ncbi:hypothetical protein A9X69_12640 [Aeromonas hydrophila]|nr:hypothetical protein A9X69_12640 [Aeromonas hydrophila]OCY09631.1 hypothetical protein A9X70_08850 [Aeromonas hydrophila]
MIIGAAQSQFVQPSQVAAQSTEYTREQQKSIVLAEDKVTLNGNNDDPSPTYDRRGLVRKVPERSLTQIAWDNLLAQRIGLSKEKLDEIEQKKKEVTENPNLSNEDRQNLLKGLETQKEALIKEASERSKERGDKEQQSNTVLG